MLHSYRAKDKNNNSKNNQNSSSSNKNASVSKRRREKNQKTEESLLTACLPHACSFTSVLLILPKVPHPYLHFTDVQSEIQRLLITFPGPTVQKHSVAEHRQELRCIRPHGQNSFYSKKKLPMVLLKDTLLDSRNLNGEIKTPEELIDLNSLCVCGFP